MRFYFQGVSDLLGVKGIILHVKPVYKHSNQVRMRTYMKNVGCSGEEKGIVTLPRLAAAFNSDFRLKKDRRTFKLPPNLKEISR